MTTLIITVPFTDKGEPKLGLTPTIRIRDLSDDSLVITDAAMVEVGDGVYRYNFTTYDETKNYSFRADGTSELTGTDRYAFGSNDNNESTQIRKIQTNKWEIVNNQWLEYDDDGSTVLNTFNLFNKSNNPTEENVFSRVPQ